MVTAATRRDARERAIELLYESHTKGVDVDEIVAGLPLTPDEYALELARGVTDHQVELDRVLSRFADARWPIERLAVTDRTGPNRTIVLSRTNLSSCLSSSSVNPK